MGVSFLCPCCCATRVAVWFENPVDGLRAQRGAEHLRRGAELADLTLVGPRVGAEGHPLLVVQGGLVVEVS